MAKSVINIHIGPHRTGTTTLQKNLSKNRGALSKQNFFYPWSTIAVFGHVHLVGDIGNFFYYDENAGGLDALREEIAEKGIIGKSRRHIILSSENFADIKTETPLQTLKDAFADHYEFKIIPYLRPQEDRLQSLWNAEIRMGITNFTFPVWVDENMSGIFSLDYDKWLTVYANVFGREAICPQLYKKNNRTLFQSFLAICGITDMEHFKIHSDQNQSISNLHAEIYRQLVLIPPLDRKRDKDEIHRIRTDADYRNAFLTRLNGVTNPMPITRTLINDFLESKDIDQSGSLFTPKLYKSIREQFRDSNKRVAQTYFNRTQLFQNRKAPKFIGPNAFQQLSKKDIAELSILIFSAYRQARAQSAYEEALET